MAANAKSTELAGLLRSGASTFVQRADTLARNRRQASPVTGAPGELWSEMAGLGWLGMLLPERCGGLGLGLREMSVVLEELGRGAVKEPWVAVEMAAGVVARSDCDTLSHRLPEYVAGSWIPTLAWQEEAGSLDPASLATTARRQGGSFRLNGRKRFVRAASAAHGFVVSALDEQGLGLYWVAAEARGTTVELQSLADGDDYGSLVLAGVEVPAERRLASGRKAEDVLRRAIDEALVLSAAELLGTMTRVFEVTLEYLRSRRQFDRPIGSFQALQHRAVDLHVQIELARSVVESAGHALDAPVGVASRAAAASRAKARCTTACLEVCQEAVQMHGAIGYTEECDVGLYLRRALVLASWLGGASRHRRRWLENARREGLEDPRSFAPEGPATDAAERHAEGAPAGRREAATVGPYEAGSPESGEGGYNTIPKSEFRRMVWEWVAANCPPECRHPTRRLRRAEISGWTAKLAAKGWLAPAWPRELGGMGLDVERQLLFHEVFEEYGVARAPDMGVTMIGPLLIQHGSEEQQQQFLPKILSNEEIWCQGYSEPEAGSDLASLRTRAELDGDAYVVNGQKTWTTLAQDADWMFALVRTEEGGRKQEGISFLLIDLSLPGITVRPIENLGGEAEFAEVFFENVRVPRRYLVGEVNAGWAIAKDLLGFERIYFGSPNQSRNALARLRAVGEARDLFADRAFADRFARLAMDVEDHAATYARYGRELVEQGALGPETSVLKICGTENFQRIAEALLESLDEQGSLEGEIELPCGESVNALYNYYLSRATTIYSGTNEIQRNIVAKALLKLPSG